MSIPDIIISWPRNTDYPLWRQMIHDHRQLFNNVIIVFTETFYGDDYRDFVREAMAEDHCIILQSPPVSGGQDWRDVAVKFGLTYSTSEWIWFTEQDFFWKEGFWEEVLKLGNEEKVGSIQTLDGGRMHPCCLFVKREILQKTRREFGIKPDRADHFYAIQEDLLRLEKEGVIENKFINPDLYNHMAGLSHNMRLLWEGNQPNHDVSEFESYMRESLKVTVPLDPRFITLAEKCVNNYVVKTP